MNNIRSKEIQMNKKYLHTLEAQIVKDVYSAISKCQKKDQYFCGGMSTHFFLPKNLHRTSSDIDTNGIQKLSLGEFQESIMMGLEELLSKGYKQSTKKKRATYDIQLEDKNDIIILQYPRKSQRSYPWLQKVTERENSNAQTVNFEGNTLRVTPTEDLLLHKFLRSKRFMENYNLKNPKNTKLDSLQNSINDLKKDHIINQFNLDPKESQKAIAKIRLYADIFDIIALSTHKELNKQYFLEGMQDYNRLKKDQKNIIDYLYSLNLDVFKGE